MCFPPSFPSFGHHPRRPSPRGNRSRPLSVRSTVEYCFALAVCLMLSACGHPVYRVDGQAAQGVCSVSLLDTSANSLLDSIRSVSDSTLQALGRSHAATIDSMEHGIANIGERREKAKDAYQSALAAYRDAFSGLSRFRSFGGNPIFSDADRKVATSVLLEEIADRFYKGKAFSLETEAEVRRYIRKRLVSPERALRQARNASLAARRSEKGAARARADLDAEHGQRRIESLSRHNEAIRGALASRAVETVQIDSLGRFLFVAVPSGDYLLYSPDLLPEGWLIPLRVAQHRWQTMLDSSRRAILLDEGNGST